MYIYMYIYLYIHICIYKKKCICIYICKYGALPNSAMRPPHVLAFGFDPVTAPAAK